MKSFAAEQLGEHYGRPVMRRKAVRSRWRGKGCRRYNISLTSSWALSVNRPSTNVKRGEFLYCCRYFWLFWDCMWLRNFRCRMNSLSPRSSRYSLDMRKLSYSSLTSSSKGAYSRLSWSSSSSVKKWDGSESFCTFSWNTCTSFAHSRAFAFRRFCFPIARSPATAAMRTMMAMVMAMICMIWSYVYATLSGGLLKVFSLL